VRLDAKERFRRIRVRTGRRCASTDGYALIGPTAQSLARP